MESLYLESTETDNTANLSVDDGDYYVTLGKNPENSIVQKSQTMALFMMQNLDLGECRLTDVYLSRVSSFEKEKRKVLFRKAEFEKIFGVKMKKKDLDARLKHLISPFTIRLTEETDTDEKLYTTLFARARTWKDKNDEIWIEMMCSDDAVKYIFDLGDVKYFRYRLRCIANISKPKCYLMFTYIELNRYKREWTESVENLKIILQCDKPSYEDFKIFNAQVLKAVCNDINKDTECKYKYEKVPPKHGKTVLYIKFTILNDIEIGVEEVKPKGAIEDKETDTNNVVEKDIEGKRQKYQALHKQISENASIFWALNFDNEEKEEIEFTIAQILELHSLITTVPTDMLPNMGYGIEIRRYHYMQTKKATLDRICEEKKNEGKPINSRFYYLKKMIESDSKEVSIREIKKEKPKYMFNQMIKHDDYDWEKIEKEKEEELIRQCKKTEEKEMKQEADGQMTFGLE